MSSTDNKNYYIHETFSYGIVYVYSIPDENHRGRLKIGSATLNSLNPTQEVINAAAHERIKQQTKTADVSYKLEHAELEITNNGTFFSDYDVHEILKRSGYERKAENVKNVHTEWFEIGLDVAKNAIQAAKEGRKALTSVEKVTTEDNQFPFRPNQLDAIYKTTKAIKQNRKHFLWNAKMRFGKTSAAMQVAKENDMKKVLIVTHRPSVGIDWHTDFNKVLANSNYEYSSKTEGEYISTHIKNNKSFVYFASLQDLRGSKRVVDDVAAKSQAMGFDKNDEIFDTTWDMLVIDEAHEGTQSNLGETTFTKIPANFTLQLSGTPFNILNKHEENDIYTWDYVMEQEEKQYWNERYPGVPNPYAELPALSMFTYDIDKFASHIGSIGDNFKDALDGAFKFHEFFRVEKDDDGNDIARFVHEDMVNKFLDLLLNNKLVTKFPYATEEYRSYNKHSLWLLPNRTKVIEAMEKILRNHPIFGKFGIVNISGDAKEDDSADTDAKTRVTSAIKNYEYTITLSGQRLTTGASIPEWTAVFMMSDTSSAITYLQTAFRCQTPAKIDGKLKTQGYIFDFAPDRTLKLVAEAIELNHKSGKTNTPEQKDAMEKFLNFCPILAADGGSMKPYDVGTMLTQLKKAIIERVSRNGFDDPKLYNDKLLQLDDLDIKRFNELKTIVGSTGGETINEIPINKLGMDELTVAKAEAAERNKKQKKELTEEEKEILLKLKEAREQRNSAISTLRAVSIRMPMMVYGANVEMKEDVTLQKFIDLVDDESWLEFMPNGLSKETFSEFAKYYDEEIFRGVSRNIRAKAFDCDDLLPTERIKAISEIFATFKNPDKETVLTPWNVVNMHITMTFGGHDFRTINSTSGKPEWVSQGGVSDIWMHDNTKVLEINSKSGLYPLLSTYNIYSRQLKKYKKSEDKIFRQLWKNILTNNIYVLCKSPMAMSITRRTLAGYNGDKTNIVYIKDLVRKLKHEGVYKSYNIINEILEKFGIENKNMKFTAVVGNPPYQQKDGGAQASAMPVYNLFVEMAKKFNPDYISMIMPTRWYAGGKGLDDFRERMLNDTHISELHDFLNPTLIFPNINLRGGICYFLWDNNYDNTKGLTKVFTYENTLAPQITTRSLRTEGFDIFIRHALAIDILKKIKSYSGFKSFEDHVSSRRPFNLDGEIISKPSIFRDSKEGMIDPVLCYGKGKKMGFLERSEIIKNKAWIEKIKVFTPYANNVGTELNDDNLNSFVGNSDTVCTETFIVIGADLKLTKGSAQNLSKYLSTKFVRFMHSIPKVSQHGTAKTYKFIPLQNFTNESTVDWSKSISDIDKQLYKKYDLDEKEINFIETHVKAMK